MVTGNRECAQARLELGVYLLGGIEPTQRMLVDRHLATCAACRAELSELAGLPPLLRRVPPGIIRQLQAENTAPETAGPPLSELLGQMAAARRRRRVLTVAAALATGIAAALGVQALHAATRPPAALVSPRTVTIQAVNPATSTWAAVRYAAEPWGTELAVSITGVAAGTRCELLVTGPAGQEMAAGGWYIAAGRQVAWYPASVPWPEPSVRDFEITADGRILVTVPAR